MLLLEEMCPSRCSTMLNDVPRQDGCDVQPTGRYPGADPRRQRAPSRPHRRAAFGRSRDVRVRSRGRAPAGCRQAAPKKPRVDRVESTGHKASRNGRAVDHIVIHYTTSRNIEGSISHFKTGTPRTSAHYIVGQDGKLVQMVPDRDSAWHAGQSDMNLRSIGIEHVARAGDRITEAQARTSVALIGWLMHAYAIPLAHVIPHACVKSTSCCGDLFKDYGGGAGLSGAAQKAALHKWLAANGIAEAGPRIAAEPPSPPDRSVPAGVRAAAPLDHAAAGARPKTHAPGHGPRHPRLRGPPRRPRADRRLPPASRRRRWTLRGGRHQRALPRGGLRRAGRAHSRRPARRGGGCARPGTLPTTPTRPRPGRTIPASSSSSATACSTAGRAVPRGYCRRPSAWRPTATWACHAGGGASGGGEPRQLVDRLRQSREAYERLRRNEASRFWRGLVNRWNKAHAKALEFMRAPAEVA